MGSHDALLIFPEGGNFTGDAVSAASSGCARPGSRRPPNAPSPRAPAAAEARRRRLLPCVPLRTSDVVVVAHTGLEQLTDLRALWRDIPVAKTLYVGWQVHAAAELPTGTAELSTWLFDRWTEVDGWIDAGGRRTRLAGA